MEEGVIAGRALPQPALLVTLIIGATIAAITPFDVVFSAATFGSPLVRAIVMGAMVVAGGTMASAAGLRLEGHGARHHWLVGLVAALAIAVWVVTLDCGLFRHELMPSYARFLHSPLSARLLYFMPRSFNENIIYRLFVFSGLVFALKKLGIASSWSIIAAMIAAQCLNIGVNLVIWEPITALRLFYDAVRYIAPGALWAWLYARFGFATAEIAAVGTHVFLQPLFSVFF